MYIFSFLLVPGWHLECPHHLFFQNLPVQKVRYSKQKVCQNYLYIYIYIHSCLFIETHCSQELLDIIYIYLYIYIYLSICVYVWMQVSYIENLQGLPKAPAKQDSWNLPKRKPTLWRIRLMTCDGHFCWFLQRFCRHRENRKHRKRRKHTLYTPKRSVFLRTYVLQYADVDVFSSARFWRSRRSRMRSRMWVRSAGWVCAQFILDISSSSVFMDWTDTVHVPCFVWFLAST